jgi:oxygen-dependent protoporphyrinogen oxidase
MTSAPDDQRDAATSSRRRPAVAVIGGGVAGLAAAWELSGGAVASPSAPDVIVLEASERLGGKLLTGELDGEPVDLGPDGFIARRPEATELCHEVGLAAELEPIGASGASIWARGRLRPLPSDLALGIPTRFWPAARSGILGLRGSTRLLVDLASPRPDVRGPLGDRAIGPLLSRKLGPRVVDRLVDPLVGGIHAGSVADMSAAAVYPTVLAVAQHRGSFMRAIRRSATTAAPPLATDAPDESPRDQQPWRGKAHTEPTPTEQAPTDPEPGEPGAPEPAFWSLRRGMGSLIDQLARRLTDRGVTIRTRAPVELLDRAPDDGPPWVVHTSDGPVLADALVIAVPAPEAARLLEPHDADAATLLRGIDYAGVALVTLAFPEGAMPADIAGTGLLVPRNTPPLGHRRRALSIRRDRGTTRGATGGDAGADPEPLITACTYLSRKWPHLSRTGSTFVRASVGRFGDDRANALDDRELVARVAAEVRAVTGIEGEPTSHLVCRWPASFPQYRVHHLLRVTGIESAVRRLPAVAVAGAAYRGVGIPACIASGRSAARAVLEALASMPSGATPPT